MSEVVQSKGTRDPGPANEQGQPRPADTRRANRQRGRRRGQSSAVREFRAIVDEFVFALTSALERRNAALAEQAVATVLAGGKIVRRRGRPTSVVLGEITVFQKPPSRRPKQLCPVPGCANVAAPVFGMVCAKHKDVPKSLLTQYRASRRAARAAGRGRAPSREGST